MTDDSILNILKMIDERAIELNKKSIAISIEERYKWFPFAYARDELRRLESELKSRYKIYPYDQKAGDAP